MSTRILYAIAFILLFVNGCGKYNYNNIFDVSDITGKKKVYVNGVEGFYSELSKQEFDDFKIKSKFHHWKRMEETYCFVSKGVKIKDDFWGLHDSEAEYSINTNSRLEGFWPAMIYYPKFERLFCFISEMGP